jgi:GT2 family glycosyltransferase
MSSVSAIICTYNREESLRLLLGDLLAQAAPAFEIIVVDQTPEPTPATLAFFANHAGHVRHLRLATPNLPGARNVGAAAAGGDVLLFMDDDVRVAPSFVGDLVAQFGDPNTDAVAPRVVPDPYEPGWDPPPGRPWSRTGADTPRDLRFCIGACYAVRRSAWDAVGGADPVMGRLNGNVAVGEDYEFTRRLTGAGYRLRYAPALTVRHVGGIAGGCEIRTGPSAYDLSPHARANAYMILKEEGGFERVTPRAALRLARLTAFRRDVIGAGPRAVVAGLGRIGPLVKGVRSFVRSDAAGASGDLEGVGDSAPL